MLKHIEIDGRLYGHCQVLKLIAYLRDRHGFTVIVKTVANSGINCWVCLGAEGRGASSRCGRSLWHCVSAWVSDVAIPLIESERKGGN